MYGLKVLRVRECKNGAGNWIVRSFFSRCEHRAAPSNGRSKSIKHTGCAIREWVRGRRSGRSLERGRDGAGSQANACYVKPNQGRYAESGRDTRVAEMASSAETSAQDIALSEAVQAGEMEREAKAVEERVLESSPLPGTDAAKKAEARREPSGISPVAEADAAADEAFADAAAARDAADRVAHLAWPLHP